MKMITVTLLALFVMYSPVDGITCDLLTDRVCLYNSSMLRCTYNLNERLLNGQPKYLSEPRWQLNGQDLNFNDPRFTFCPVTSTSTDIHIINITNSTTVPMSFSCSLVLNNGNGGYGGSQRSNTEEVVPEDVPRPNVTDIQSKVHSITFTLTHDPGCYHTHTFYGEVHVNGKLIDVPLESVIHDPITIPNLQSGTMYNVTVKAKCRNDPTVISAPQFFSAQTTKASLALDNDNGDNGGNVDVVIVVIPVVTVVGVFLVSAIVLAVILIVVKRKVRKVRSPLRVQCD